MNECAVLECVPAGRIIRGWCPKHYQRWRKYGDPLGGGRRYKTPEEAFAARTEWRGECLVWTGGLNTNGYGQINVLGKAVLAHRYSYEKEQGAITIGQVIDHLCHNKACVNYLHLRAVPQQMNMENLSGPYVTGTSGFRGVTWDKQHQKWRSHTQHSGRKIHGRRFTDIEDANLHAIELRNLHHTGNYKDRN